ncbi:hypothetical protein [Polynucleobacter necessarius]|uniref:hypothetical protein n=1 Tax=Polynucleobacter necessarius TaxID=576610 RepID=UPI000FE26CF6|nr:hypothetical protein [Polynucleobacter necessarius]
MVAYFYSKFTKQTRTALSVFLLLFCLIGTHWIGFSHSISHAQPQGQANISLNTESALPSLNHSSDVCHLFDALTLAGFIAVDSVAGGVHNAFTHQPSFSNASFIAQASIKSYQSRAPPSLLL